MTKQRGRAKYRLTVKLDMEWDADVIAWLMKFPRGQRSTAVRDAIRGVLSPTKAADLDTIRTVIAEELAGALARQSPHVASGPTTVEGNAAEAKFGAKLDKMMGGLSKIPRGSDISE
jgi:hypothetical protein